MTLSHADKALIDSCVTGITYLGEITFGEKLPYQKVVEGSAIWIINPEDNDAVMLLYGGGRWFLQSGASIGEDSSPIDVDGFAQKVYNHYLTCKSIRFLKKLAED